MEAKAFPLSRTHFLYSVIIVSRSGSADARRRGRQQQPRLALVASRSRDRQVGLPPSLPPPSFWTRALGLFILACSRAPSERCQSVRGPSVRPSVRVRPFHWAFFPLLPSIPFYLRLGGVRERGRLALV